MKILIGIAILIVVIIVVNVANDFESGGDGTATNPICSTKCTWLREKNCETNEAIGWCFPSWGCGDGIGQHPCTDR